MSVMNMWSVCDRCGFNYKRRQLTKESSGWVVCRSCYDGEYDLLRSPQDRAPPIRLESRKVPDGRIQQLVQSFLTMEDGGWLLFEDDSNILVTQSPWTPSQSLAF
jgi:hypothetical protein